MKIKNAEILSAQHSLRILGQDKLPVKGALKVRKLARFLATAWEIIEEVRKKLLEEHAARDEAGNLIPGEPVEGQQTTKLDEEKKQAFFNAYQDLMSQQTDIDDALRLTVDDLGNREISPTLLIDLGDLLVD